MKINKQIVKLPLVILMFMAGSLLQAQDEDGSSSSDDTGGVGEGGVGEISVGAKVVGQASKFEDSKMGLGYGVGAYATYQPLSFLTIQVEVLYAETAGRLDDYSTTNSLFDSTEYTKRTLRIRSLEIPVIVRYGLPFDLFGMSTNVYVGGAYSYNMSVAEIEDKTHYYNDGVNVLSSDFKNSRNNVSSNYTPYNMEALIGFGVNLDLFGMPAQIDLRYKQGFQNLSRLNTLPVEGGTFDFKSRVISLNLGVNLYKF